MVFQRKNYDAIAMRQEKRKDDKQKHSHRLNWAEFTRETILLIALFVGGVYLATKSQEPTLHAAGISVFSGVAGAVIRSFGANSMKKIVVVADLMEDKVQ